ncbi:hypothetical protein KI387_027513, partial [Taxus chinensis]
IERITSFPSPAACSILAKMDGFKKPHVVVVPFPALGHSIPSLDLAKLLASNGLAVSYVTTQGNVSRLRHLHVEEAEIKLVVLPTPAVEGLPQALESTDVLPLDKIGLIFDLVQNLQQPFNVWMEQQFQNEGVDRLSEPPVCVIHDILIGWAVETAQKHKIASFLFNIFGAFAMNLLHSMACSIFQNQWTKEGEDSVLLSINMPHPLRTVQARAVPESLPSRSF